MTDRTKRIIDQYRVSRDIHLLPSIVIGLQEEDGVANVVQFKNCFRQIRNLAAHEPDTLVTQLLNTDNRGSAKIVFIPKQDETNNRVVLDTIQFTAWMFDMFLRTREFEYIIFWETTLEILYTKQKSGELVKSALNMENHNNDMLKWYLNWQTLMWEKKGVPRIIATKDPYVINMYQTNVRVFWRMALPNLMELVLMMLRGEISTRDIKNIEGFIRIFKEKEGV
jgi:hypothetical protein